MSLFPDLYSPEDQKLAQIVYDEQLQNNVRISQGYDERQKKLMYQDILYNISYLKTAIKLDESKIFVDYAVWLYELLCSLLKAYDRDEMMRQMIEHYDILQRHLADHLDASELDLAQNILAEAVHATRNAVADLEGSRQFQTGKHVEIRKAYLSTLLHGDTKQAMQIIRSAATSIPLVEIYEDILQKVMHEVGELWHRGDITVDKEHYCTSVTQMVLSQFYDDIFAQPRKPYRILVCSVGSELHEMGGRMVADLFEYHGWDSVYLGAGVPSSALLHAVGDSQPHLIALSVTMPQHLIECETMVRDVKAQYPAIKIAVGGRAFSMTHELWRKWPVDHHAISASKLIAWAEEAFHE